MPVRNPDATWYLGVDPGASGGLAALNGREVRAVPTPATERDVWDWFQDFRSGELHALVAAASGKKDFALPLAFAVVEKVGGYVGQAQPGSAAFKFGASYGALRMALTAAGVPYEEATPQRWQKALGLGTRRKGESKTSWKNRLKSAAQRLFPSVKVTLATADALLIAAYCQRLRTGTL
jgi:hypothetical protein